MDSEDGETNGMIYGEQHNTLDAEWYGNIPVITSLYLAALAAGKEMANEMKDTSFYNTCSTILDKGQKYKNDKGRNMGGGLYSQVKSFGKVTF